VHSLRRAQWRKEVLDLSEFELAVRAADQRLIPPQFCRLTSSIALPLRHRNA
jgi:hypothetical protein